MSHPAEPPHRRSLVRHLTRLATDIGRDDARLAAASLGFARAEGRRSSILKAGDNGGSTALSPVLEWRSSHLEALCNTRAVSHGGHRARALAYCIWDDGELARRAAGGILEDRLLWAIVSDLAAIR